MQRARKLLPVLYVVAGAAAPSPAAEPAIRTPGAQAQEKRPATWDTVFSLPKDGASRWLAGLWANESDIFAVGDQVIVRCTRIPKGCATTPLNPGENLQEVWGRGIGDLYAVGGHGLIMHSDGSGWRVEQKLEVKRRARHDPDLLVALFPRITETIAFGIGISFARSGGTWIKLSEQEHNGLHSYWIWPDRAWNLCGGKSPSFWTRAMDLAVWMQCPDGMLSRNTGKGWTTHGRAPKECGSNNGVAAVAGKLFLACGSEGRIWKNEGTGWRFESTPCPVRKLFSAGDELYALCPRTVLQRRNQP